MRGKRGWRQGLRNRWTDCPILTRPQPGPRGCGVHCANDLHTPPPRHKPRGDDPGPSWIIHCRLSPQRLAPGAASSQEVLGFGLRWASRLGSVFFFSSPRCPPGVWGVAFVEVARFAAFSCSCLGEVVCVAGLACCRLRANDKPCRTIIRFAFFGSLISFIGLIPLACLASGSLAIEPLAAREAER